MMEHQQTMGISAPLRKHTHQVYDDERSDEKMDVHFVVVGCVCGCVCVV